MSYSIDFHFSAVEPAPPRWLEQLDERLRLSGFQRLSVVHGLEVDDESEVDEAYPSMNLPDLADIARLLGTHYGISLLYAAPGIDLAVYGWLDHGLQLVMSVNNRQWVSLLEDGRGAFRIGSALCGVAAALGIPFGYSMMNSVFQRSGRVSLADVLNAFERRTPEPEIAWLSESTAERHGVKPMLGSERQVAVTRGYVIVLYAGSR